MRVLIVRFFCSNQVQIRTEKQTNVLEAQNKTDRSPLSIYSMRSVTVSFTPQRASLSSGVLALLCVCVCVSVQRMATFICAPGCKPELKGKKNTEGEKWRNPTACSQPSMQKEKSE